MLVGFVAAAGASAQTLVVTPSIGVTASDGSNIPFTVGAGCKEATKDSTPNSWL
jgi:hypothetical protein